jgi:hypothetical protein
MIFSKFSSIKLTYVLSTPFCKGYISNFFIFRPPLVISQKNLTKIYAPYLETLMHAKLRFNKQ